MHKKFTLALVLAANALSLSAVCWYEETLHEDWRQTFKCEHELYREKTEFQDLVIFKNNRYGTVMALDGVIQTTEADEFCYHEMITHVPILSHGNVKKVLIIGGGDGGALREILRHESIECVIMVELDDEVVNLSKKYFPGHSKGGFEDPRFKLVIQDGCKFVKETEEKFDVIVCDSTDPIGPGAVLFTEEFYRDCQSILTKDGILVTQSSVPFEQKEELRSAQKNLKASFKDVSCYLTVVPTYVGGFMTLGWATNNAEHRAITVEELSERMAKMKGEFNYYTPEVHKAAFALPQFIKNIIN